MSWKTRELVAGVLVLGLGSEALCMCPYPAPKVCSELFRSDAVFVGRVVSRMWGDVEIRFDVQVVRVLKGAVGERVTVYTGNDSARLGWNVGRTYVAFATLRQGRLESEDDCGPLSDPDSVAETVRQIEALQEATGAVVEGEVVDWSWKGIPGVRVQVIGANRRYEGRTDEAGQFRMSVAPGRYRMPIDDSRFRQSDYNLRTDLDRIDLVDGQCAQVQLVPNQHVWPRDEDSNVLEDAPAGGHTPDGR